MLTRETPSIPRASRIVKARRTVLVPFLCGVCDIGLCLGRGEIGCLTEERKKLKRSNA